MTSIAKLPATAWSSCGDRVRAGKRRVQNAVVCIRLGSIDVLCQKTSVCAELDNDYLPSVTTIFLLSFSSCQPLSLSHFLDNKSALEREIVRHGDQLNQIVDR
jgi:hypothetical protein